MGDDGVGLSGGERQRLAIARALLGDAPLLLLDEPTATLDGRNERAMHEAIRTAAVGRTVLIVAHRLATVVDADQIVVLDAGRVAATGTHAELLDSQRALPRARPAPAARVTAGRTASPAPPERPRRALDGALALSRHCVNHSTH